MQPFYQDEMVKIYCADNREVLPELSTIDACVTDPPYAPYGGIVLDPFAGTGSTAIAARKLGFRCILIEKDRPSCEIAAGRCTQIMQLSLAQPIPFEKQIPAAPSMGA